MRNAVFSGPIKGFLIEFLTWCFANWVMRVGTFHQGCEQRRVCSSGTQRIHADIEDTV